MPRIDPLQLLKCLSVLLGPTGGIKSNDEVQRLASLMTKFSKKLVSKCIYIQILKTTNTDLLGQFMGAGGWNLVHMWLTDGILAKNWALIQELLELLLLCPVDVERLKTNNCPKLIKGLSKEGSHHVVRVLASRLVEQWLKIVKGEAAPNSVPADIMTLPIQTLIGQSQSLTGHQQYARSNNSSDHTIENGELHDGQLQSLDFTENQSNVAQLTDKLQQLQRPQQSEQPTKNPQPQQKQYYLVSSSSQQQQQQQQSLPVYKITIRDGKQVLAKVETDPANINNVLNINNSNNDSRTNGNENEDRSGRDGDMGTIEESIQGAQELVLDNSNHLSSEVKESVASSKDINTESNSDDVRDNNKDSKEGVVGDCNKSSDKENRDFHKKEDKKSASSSDKKLNSHSSSSRSSSKHGSSSHRSSSSSHRSSSHRSSSGGSKRSSSKEKSSSRDNSSKDKDKHRSSSSSKHSSSSSSSKGVKSDREKDREREKEKLKKDQAEKDKATLEKVQGQALSTKMGKIPKKRAEDELRQSADSSPSRKLSTDSKEGKEKTDAKKASIPEKKTISISIESRKNLVESSRPKTVKTFNSKFRSTGLEEEVKPPPPRFSKKPGAAVDKKLISPKVPALKRPSPLRETIPLPDKRARLSLDSPTTPPPTEDKKGGIKLIPAKPKPMVLQESDMFMDALTASTKSKEPRKRKRRTSLSKDGAPDPKKPEVQSEGCDATPPPSSPLSSDEKSPVVVKPNFKFYQDTLETDEDKEKKVKDEIKEELKKEKDEAEAADEKELLIKELKESKENNDEEERATTPTPDDEIEDNKGSNSPIETTPETSESDRKEKRDLSPSTEIRYVNGLKSVLLSQKRKGPKKTLKWKTDLESIRYFELDETERVNVTKTFTDAKQMEKQNEREAFQMARKLSTEDLMEEKTVWKPLIPVDLPPALVDHGKNSREKDIQYAREKGILQALYFNRSMIPDSAAEPDEERHPMTDPKVIPLEDLTGNKESEKDFTSMAWPEPKPQIFQAPAVPAYSFPPFPHAQPSMMGLMGPQGPIPPMGQMSQQMMAPGPMGPMGQMGPMGPEMAGPMPSGGGGWRTGDGKVVVPDVGMSNMPGGYPPGPDGPLGPPGMMGPPMFNQPDGFGMMGPPDDMGYGPGNMGNNFQGPPGSGMYGPGPGPGPGPNFQGGPRGGPMRGGPGGMGRGGPGPGWYRGGGGGGGGGPISGRGGGGWRGGGGGGGWRGNGKQPPICRQFSKNGYCRVGDKCQYLHPGVNCPPF